MKVILCIEDDDVTASLVKLVLEDAGYVVYTTGSAEDGLSLLCGLAPDLVISDMWLPGMSGSDFVIAKAELEPHALIPVVLMTGVSSSALQPAGLFAAHLRKPFDIDVLIETVERVLAARSPLEARGTTQNEQLPTERPGGE